MEWIIITLIIILSLFYISDITIRKFKYEDRKDIKLLQIIIFTLSLFGFITGTLIFLIPVIVILIIILATSPKKFLKLFRIALNRYGRRE